MRELDPDIAIFNLRPFEEIVSTSISQARFNATLLASFGGIALLLACIGVYGVMSYSVNQQRHEIGIRMALGQERSSVLKNGSQTGHRTNDRRRRNRNCRSSRKRGLA